jgi:hypothetical protein
LLLHVSMLPKLNPWVYQTILLIPAAHPVA